MRRYLAVALAVLTVPTALALAAKEGKYKGKVVGDRDGDVTFRVKGRFVREFEIDSVTATCYPLTAVTVYVPKARIRDNRFRRNYKPLPEDEHVIKLRGRFDGNRARGTVKGGPNCVYEERWRARRR